MAVVPHFDIRIIRLKTIQSKFMYLIMWKLVTNVRSDNDLTVKYIELFDPYIKRQDLFISITS